MKRPYDPCLDCILPDCDERSRNCGLNKCHRIFKRLRRRGAPVPQHIRDGYRAYHREWKIENRAEHSERRS